MAQLRQGEFRIVGKIRILFYGDHTAAVCRQLRDCDGQNARPGTQIKDADRLMYWSEQTGGLIGDRSGRQKTAHGIAASRVTVLTLHGRGFRLLMFSNRQHYRQVGAGWMG